ncbi:MAG: LPS export ABC transporter permease LptF [bacterium]
MSNTSKQRLSKLPILDRYILRELLSPFYLGMMVFTFIFMITQVLRITEMILNKGVPLVSALQLFGYLIPSFLVLVIPSTVLLASLVGFGRMAGDCEAVALSAGGISFYRLLRPVLIFSLTAYLATMYIMISLVPKANGAFTRTVYQMIKSNAVLNLQEKVFFGGLEGLVIYVDKVPRDGSPYRRVFISDHRKSDTQYIITAEQGVFGFDKRTETIYAHLTDGEIHQLTPKGRYRRLTFKAYDIDFDSRDFFRKKRKRDRELTVKELKEKIRERRKEGLNYLPQQVELYKKYAIPFSTLLFGFLGAPLGMRRRSSSQSKSFAFAFGILIVFVYYLLLRTTETFGDNGIIVPWFSVWIPNIILALPAGYLVRSENRQRSIGWVDWIGSGLDSLIRKIRVFRTITRR